MHHRRTLVFLVLMLFTFLKGFAQQDTVKISNGNVLYGKIKQVNSGVLTLKTSFSDSDFKIDFNEVGSLYITRKCFVIFTQGRRRMGYIQSESNSEVSITTSNEAEKEVFNTNEIIRIEVMEDLVLKRFSGNFDIGYNLTKANNAAQLTISGGLNYKGPDWIFNSDFNSFRSRQDNIDRIQRTNAHAELKRLLLEKWYLLGSLGYLSNTQQALNSRHNARLGVGRYLASNNKLLFGLSLGLNYNNEDFVDVTRSRESAEFFLSSNLNLFNFKDVELISRLDYYPSLTENGRQRTDFMFDAKYKLPLDFYIKAGLQFNYDNQSAIMGSNFDYIFTTGFGWKFN